MKKVIFVCLLSLSICLSKAADEQGKQSQVQNTNVTETKIIKNTTQESKDSPNATTMEQKPAKDTDLNNNTKHLQEASTVPNTKNATQPASDENKTTDKKNTVPQIDTDKKKEESPVTESSTETKGPVDNKDKAKNSTKPEEKPEKDTASTTTEISTVTNKPTEAPKKDEDKPTLQARGFDGPSFIGGIILTLGLLAIGFMGFKYYKTQTERNYHTL